jgi:putative aldouronate transport system substrate-binding protein
MVLGLVACSSSTNTTTTSSTAQTSTVPALKGAGNVTLKRLGQSISWDPNTDGMAEVIKGVTGYDVEYYTLPSENADEKLAADVAGGADYDIININTSQWRTLVAQGALQPLDDLLEAYGQDILAGVSDTVWDAMRGDDGHIYGVVYMYPHSHEIATFMQCRLDLMEAAGITEIPTTIDEFYDCLVTLKNYYGDEYIIFTGPFTPASEGNENWVIPKTIASAFGIYNDWMVDENGQVYYMTEAPQFAEMIEFLTKLYNEGLIDPDWAINTNSSIQEKFASGRSIITASNRSLASKCGAALVENMGLSWDDIGYISAERL